MPNATHALLENGDFIRVPAWKVEGQVVSVEPDRSGLGSDDALCVLLQHRPEGMPRRYRLEPNEYEVL